MDEKKGSNTKLPLQKILTGKLLYLQRHVLRLKFATRRRYFAVIYVAFSSSE